MTRPSVQDLLAETARRAHRLHRPLDTILAHPDRRRMRSGVALGAGEESER